MQISAAGVDFIKSWEGFEARAYRDGAGVWTIGYGHTEGFRDGAFGPDAVITLQAATALLEKDLAPREKAVGDAVTVALEQYEFDALTSLLFNIGAGGFRRSTVLRRLNQGDREGAGAAFLMWNKITVDGTLRTSFGLTRRRQAESALFLKGRYQPA